MQFLSLPLHLIKKLLEFRGSISIFFKVKLTLKGNLKLTLEVWTGTTEYDPKKRPSHKLLRFEPTSSLCNRFQIFGNLKQQKLHFQKGSWSISIFNYFLSASKHIVICRDFKILIVNQKISKYIIQTKKRNY